MAHLLPLISLPRLPPFHRLLLREGGGVCEGCSSVEGEGGGGGGGGGREAGGGVHLGAGGS